MTLSDARALLHRPVSLRYQQGQMIGTVTPIGLVEEGVWGWYFVLDGGRRLAVAACEVVGGEGEGFL